MGERIYIAWCKERREYLKPLCFPYLSLILVDLVFDLKPFPGRIQNFSLSVFLLETDAASHLVLKTSNGSLSRILTRPTLLNPDTLGSSYWTWYALFIFDLT